MVLLVEVVSWDDGGVVPSSGVPSSGASVNTVESLSMGDDGMMSRISCSS